jgi:hypothetical protein
VARASSSASYGARNPTRSRRQREPILQTYDEGNCRGRAGDGGAVRSVLGDGEDGLWWCSHFEERLYNFVLLPSSSSLGQLPQTLMPPPRPISVGQCLDWHSQTQTQRQTQMPSLSECRCRLRGATWLLLLLCPHGKRIWFGSGHSVIGKYIVDLFSFFNFIHDAHFSLFIVFQFLVRQQF